MNSEIKVVVDPVEIVKIQQNAKDIMVNPEVEDSIVRLLEIKREVDGAVEALKSEIERQALEFNPNFTAIKGEKIKINYSASGAKYADDGTAKNHRGKFWTKKITWSLNSKAIDEYMANRYIMPKGIKRVERRKTIRISEVANAD